MTDTKTFPDRPKNLNPAYNTQFRMVITRTPDTTYFLQDFTLPSVSLPQVQQPTRWLDVPMPGEKLTYESLSTNMLLGEDMTNYSEVLTWMQTIAGPEEVENRLIKRTDWVSDISVYVLTNLGNPNKEIVFKDCFPTSLGAIDFTLKSETEPIIVPLEFSYSHFIVKQ